MRSPLPSAPPQLGSDYAPDEMSDAILAPETPEMEQSLQISQERMRWLIEDRICPRISEVMREMGRSLDGSIQPMSWMAQRVRNKDTYDNNLEWRKTEIGGVFADGMNLTKGTNRRYARLIAARVRDDLVGTRPFFGAMSSRNGNPELTKQVEEYIQEEIEHSNVTEAIREALRVALICDEAVVKTSYAVNQSHYIGPAKGVFVDQAGQPVTTPRGFFVFDKDDVIPDPQVEGLVRLVKDPGFAFQQGQYGIVDVPRLPQILTHYNGPRCDVLDARDFLCPLKSRTTWEADINVHLYEATLEEMRAAYGGLVSADEYFEFSSATTGIRQARTQGGETEEEKSMTIPRKLWAETYVRVPIHEDEGDTREYELIVLLDLHSKKALFADYLGNHMARRPFAVIPGIEREPFRWWGIGVFTKMMHSGLYIDAQINRINEKDSQSASVTYFHRKAVKAWEAGEPFSPGSKKALEVQSSWPPEIPIAGRINLNENANLGMELMVSVEQASDLEFAVISARDASASSLNQSKTATGVMSIERDANVVTKDTEQDHIRGIEDILEQVVELILSQMDETEMMFNKDGSELITLNRDEIRSMEKKVRLLLTKTRSAESLAIAQQSEAIATRYFQLPLPQQFYLRDLFIRQLKGLEVDNAGDLLPEISEEQFQQWQQEQAAAKEPPKPPSKNIATKFNDLARSEQEQLLGQLDIQPASAEEVAQKQAEEAMTEIAIKQAGKQPITENEPRSDT